ncbi:MAG: hypothetical protein EOO59_03700, partial [Hymenobacter sp.]
MAETLARRVFEWVGGRPWAVLLLTLAVALPALLLHLGWQPLLVDEPIRALVSLEMHYSGQFFAPTLQGFPYYNKPPLFNWLLVALFRLSGRHDEWIVRLPTVAALLLYCAAIWRVLRPRLGSRVAFTVALAFATTGRVLFYDSFLGLIDLWHAGLTWLAFMAVWHLGQRGQWGRLFVLTYALTAVGFLLKGLPSLVFQALALGVYCLATKQVKRLFSWQHVLGVLVLVGILGAYFLIYSHHNSLATALATLWDQSSQRTVAAQRLQDSVRYVLLFPFDFIRHFLPWTLLLVLLLPRRARQLVWAEPFLCYNALLFLAVLPVYWLSPATIPRYLFMLVPLGLTVLIPLYPAAQLGAANLAGAPGAVGSLEGAPVRWLNATLLLLLAVTALAPLVGGLVAVAPALGPVGTAVLTHLRGVPAYWLPGALLSLVLAGLTYLFWKMPDYRLLLLGYFLLVLRLSFDVFVFPGRLVTSPEVAYRAAAVRVGRETRGRPLELWPNALLDNVEAYYIARERGQTLFTAHLPPRPGMLYLAEPWQAQATGRPFRVLDKFVIDRKKD